MFTAVLFNYLVYGPRLKKESFSDEAQRDGDGPHRPHRDGPHRDGPHRDGPHRDGPEGGVVHRAYHHEEDSRRRGVVSKDVETTVWVMSASLIALLIVVGLIELIASIFAVYLSWTSNTLVGWNGLMKVLFAIVAFFQGCGYLIIHLVNKVDLLSHIRKTPSPVRPSPTPVITGGTFRASNARAARYDYTKRN